MRRLLSHLKAAGRTEVSASSLFYMGVGTAYPLALAVLLWCGASSPHAPWMTLITPIGCMITPCPDRHFGNKRPFYWVRQTAFGLTILAIVAIGM